MQHEIMKKFSRKVLTNMEVKAMIWGKLAVANLLFDRWLAVANLSGMINGMNQVIGMNLTTVQEGKEYIIERIETDDEELNAFLFSLGCYSGEPITVVSRRKGSCVVSIKDGRYNIDDQLAAAIIVW